MLFFRRLSTRVRGCTQQESKTSPAEAFPTLFLSCEASLSTHMTFCPQMCHNSYLMRKVCEVRDLWPTKTLFIAYLDDKIPILSFDANRWPVFTSVHVLRKPLIHRMDVKIGHGAISSK